MEISRALVAVTRATRYANRIALYTPTRIVIGSRQKSPFRLLATLALQSFSLHQSLSSPLLSAPSYSRNLQNRSFSSILSIRFHCIYHISVGSFWWTKNMKEIWMRIERFSFFFLEFEKSIKEIPCYRSIFIVYHVSLGSFWWTKFQRESNGFPSFF